MKIFKVLASVTALFLTAIMLSGCVVRIYPAERTYVRSGSIRYYGAPARPHYWRYYRR